MNGLPSKELVPATKTEHKRSRLFLPAFVVGWGIIAFGATRALGDARDAHPFALVVHVVGLDIVHDTLLAPLAVLVGWALGRLLPKAVRGPVRSAVAMSVLLLVFAYPLVRRWGARPTNSSTLPLPYGRNLAILLGIVWLAAAVVSIHRVRRPDAD